MSLRQIEAALAGQRFETARRLGLAALREQGNRDPELLFALHDALVSLADFQGARRLLEENQEHLQGHAFQSRMRLAHDFQKLTGEAHYRTSAEVRQGFTIDEYKAKYIQLAEQELAAAAKLAATEEEQSQLAAFGKREEPKRSAPAHPGVRPEGNGSICGHIIFANGAPGVGLEVTLGLEAEVDLPDPSTFVTTGLGYSPTIHRLEKLCVVTDAAGGFRFENVPPGTQEFIAVTMPPEHPGVRTRFLCRHLVVRNGERLDVGELTVTDWESAAALKIESPHPSEFTEGARRWKKCSEYKLHNPFHYEFPRQLLQLELPPGAGSLRVMVEPGVEEPHQVVEGRVALMAGLPALSNKVIALYRTDKRLKAAEPEQPLRWIRNDSEIWELDTGVAAFRIAGDAAPPDTPPLLSVRGPDGVWRGTGRFRLPEGLSVKARTIRVTEEGALLVRVQIAHTLSNEEAWSVELTALAGEPHLLLRESCTAEMEGAFEFSLREFSGGRGFLHWTPEGGSLHWRTLEAREEVVGRLPESVPWWIPPQGFAYAMTPDGLEERDYIGVFSRRRGEWEDRALERISKGPVDEAGRENRELDWPFPEMVGSSISMITVHTDDEGDAYFRFPFFEGERKWGLLVSSFEQNDGPLKQIGRIQHASSSPRLQEFKDWHLDVPDALPRPHLLADRNDLPALRRKAASGPFSGLWRKILSQSVPGPRDGLVFALDGDPVLAWRKRIELLSIADIRSKLTLLGRDFSDLYSPVGGRPITVLVEEYDLLAGSGLFSPEEERKVRAFFILMAHMFMEPDLMNWRYGGRNANFEADRVDIISAVGLAFRGHPDAPLFLDHAVDCTRDALVAYCTPGSGKWYENPACYYLHASKCRMNLVYHLAHKGLLQLDQVPRLKEFLRWGLLLLTPPQPVDYAVMRDGDETAFLTAPKVRKIPPIGDHAGIGRWLPEHYAFIGKLYRHSDPDFAEELIHGYFCGNADGKRLLGRISWERDGPEANPANDHHASQSGNLPLFFCAMEEGDLPEAPEVHPVSRRLEGFGVVLRNKVGTPEESYLLIKQGPGGYRYHRTEGSFLLFCQGRPLVYDGGEAGETWRHSTLSFHDVQMPLSAGRVENYFDRQGFQFVQGVHPVILQPGEPVFLSDNCHHELVEEAWRRFRIEPPAVVRSFAWIDGRYLILHDDLSASRPAVSNWHLQVVGEAPSSVGGNHFRFPGRFGIDLEVHFPSQTFSEERVENLPIMHYQGAPEQWFSMQHLQLGKRDASHYLAVLRGVETNDWESMRVESPEDHTVKIYHAGGQDLLWFCRSGMEWSGEGTHFSGSYGAFLKQKDSSRLVVIGPGELHAAGLALRSDGPRALLAVSENGMQLETEGEGRVEIKGPGLDRCLQITEQCSIQI